MKFSPNLVVTFVLALASDVSAFAPRMAPPACSSTTTTLNLFGGGNKSTGGDATAKKGPGMMDQLAMFKKAAEMAQKKSKLDQELAAESFEGTAADGKVTAVCKFLPPTNPMDPQPEYEFVSFVFDDEWYEAASPEDVSVAVKEAIIDGTAKANTAVGVKYQILAEGLQGLSGAPAENSPPALE